MQQIVHADKNIHPVFDAIERLYAFVSDRDRPSTITNLAVFPSSFEKTYILLQEYGKVKYDVNFNVKSYDKLKVDKYPTKNIIVCFSGGKDSVATVLHYQKLRYNIVIYHSKGINQTYKDEWKSAQKLAEKLGCRYVQDEVQLSGSHDWIEHPLKNMIIANRALQWGIRNGFSTKIAFGNYSTSSVDDDPFDVCGGDDKETWRAYEAIIKTVLPKFKIYTPLRNIQSSFTALEKHPELLPEILSCIGPYRYREYLHTNNEKKYKLKLLPHRCGSCWKCAVEYIYYTDHNILEYSRDYYKHCIQILKRTLKKENAVKIRNDKLVWREWCFYSIEKSKYFKDVS